jgi:uncharacterized protein YdaU (DUF1376 family)
MTEKASKLLAEWFWTDRWIGSSAFLLPIEPRGLYREMLTQAWRRGGRLPNDPEAIRRAVGCTTQEWRRCWPQVEKYWRVDGADIVNDTQLDVWAETQAAHERAVSRGSKGGKARAQALEQARARALEQALEQAVPKVELVRKPPTPSPSPDDHPLKNTGDLKTHADRAGAFMDYYREKHMEVFDVAYMGSNRDFVKVLELCEVFTDSQMRDAAMVWFGMIDDFATNGTRTVPKFASRITACLQLMKAHGIAS